MNKDEKKSLLDELEKISRRLERRRPPTGKPGKGKAGYRYPIIRVFDLHLEGYSVQHIARKTKLPSTKVLAILHGGMVIPEDMLPDVKALGVKICSCCNQRIVPLYPVNSTILVKLCASCWKNEDTIIENPNHSRR